MNPEDILTESRQTQGACSVTPFTGETQNRRIWKQGETCGLGTVNKGAGFFGGIKIF